MDDQKIWRLRIAWGIPGQINIDDHRQSKFEDASKENLERIANEMCEACDLKEKYFYEIRTIDQIIKYRLDSILQIVIHPEKPKTRGD